MEFQTLKGSRNKKIVIGVIVFITIISMILIGRSYASYRTTQSVNIANGKINYKVPDLRVVAVKLQSSSGSAEYTDSNTIPTSGYILNTTRSVCGQSDGNGYATKDNDIILDYRAGRLYADNLKKNTRCYLYFDIQSSVTSTDIIANHKIGVRTFDGPLTEETTGTLYVGYDNDGPSYVYAGKVNDNWVKFGKETVDGVQKDIWWRIIRFNGDESTRLIYTGTTAPTQNEQYVMTGTGTQITVNGNNTFQFNTNHNDNAYVGYMYGTPGSNNYEDTHANINDSNAKEILDTWYTSNLSDYSTYIVQSGKFCNDRQPSTSNSSSNGLGGTGTIITYYGSYIRLTSNRTPILECHNANDTLNLNIGLITADEAVFAGGTYRNNNYDYYLNSLEHYWTLSPYILEVGFANVFFILSNGNVGFGWAFCDDVSNLYGLRPVINLNSNITFTGSGTYNDPYMVS